MSLALITQPAFLHAHFLYTRQGLLGQWPKKAQVQSAVTTQPAELPDILELGDAPVARPSYPVLPEIETKVIHPVKQSSQTDVIPEQYARSRILTRVRAQERRAAAVATAKPQSLLKRATKFVLSIVIALSIGVAGVIVVPEVYYSLFSAQTEAVNQVASAAKIDSQALPVTTPEPEPYMPPQNPDLPTGTWISIPRIGVYTEMLATDNPDVALETGVWLVPDFGRPGDTTQPVIAAAHRFGWDWWWKTDYWKYNSFYLLTETEPGDRIEVIYDQRKWVYKIYAGEEGELITDYNADLILYTCKYLNSPIRHFRYAMLVKE